MANKKDYGFNKRRVSRARTRLLVSLLYPIIERKAMKEEKQERKAAEQERWVGAPKSIKRMIRIGLAAEVIWLLLFLLYFLFVPADYDPSITKICPTMIAICSVGLLLCIVATVRNSPKIQYTEHQFTYSSIGRSPKTFEYYEVLCVERKGKRVSIVTENQTISLLESTMGLDAFLKQLEMHSVNRSEEMKDA